MGMVDIKGLDKAEVLYTLWRHSHTQGNSFLGLTPEGFTLQKARERIKDLQEKNARLYFDYVEGHVIKCDITDDTFDEFLYDRDCGPGAAENAINELRLCTTIKDNVIKTASEIDFDYEMQAATNTACELELENELRARARAKQEPNENMTALKEMLTMMKASAEQGFKQGIVMDPPCYLVTANYENSFVIMRLDITESFTLTLPHYPLMGDDPDLFTITPEGIFMPTHVNVYMREDDDILNIPDVSHIPRPWHKFVLKLVEYLKERVSQFKKVNPNLQHTIFTHGERIYVNANALDILKPKDPYKPDVTVIRGREEVYEKVKKDFDEMVKNGIEKTVIEGMKNNEQE